jgi:hypothetical protein
MNDAADFAAAALAAALAGHVDEPEIEYQGARYGESELRHLEQTGALASLGELAPFIPYWLRLIDAARRPPANPTFGSVPTYQIEVLEGLGWGDDPPPGCLYRVPAGWSLTVRRYAFSDP